MTHAQIRHHLGVLLGLATPLGAFAAAVVFLVATATLRGPLSLAGFLAIVTLLMIAAGLIVVAAHELGHFFVSRLVGFRTISLTIGPLRFLNTRQGIRLRSAENWRLGGGMLMCLPRHDRQLRLRWMAVVAAGPLASLLLAPASFLLSRSLLESPSAVASLAATMLLPAIALVSLVAGVGSLVPSGHGMVLSDGAQLRLLWSGGPLGERLCAQIALTAAARDGVRPREWRAEWIRSVTAVHDETPQEAIGHLSAFYVALDSGDATLARLHLARARAVAPGLPALLRALVELEAAYFEATAGGNVAAARESLGMARVAGVPRFAMLRAEAAVLVAEGDRDRALVLARTALDALQTMEREELVRLPAEAEWIRELLRRAGGASQEALAS